jgi:hypothetical protein
MPLPLHKTDLGECSEGTVCLGGAKIPSLSSMVSSQLHYDTTSVKSSGIAMSGFAGFVLHNIGYITSKFHVPLHHDLQCDEHLLRGMSVIYKGGETKQGNVECSAT